MKVHINKLDGFQAFFYLVSCFLYFNINCIFIISILGINKIEFKVMIMILINVLVIASFKD